MKTSNNNITEQVKKKILSTWKVKEQDIETTFRVIESLTLWEFNSVWKLKIKNEVVNNRSIRNIYKQYLESNFFKPSNTEFEKLRKVENTLLKCFIEDYRFIETSPIVPIGLNYLLWWIDINKSMINLNNSESISELTILLTLECAKTLKENKLKNQFSSNHASFARLIRNQTFKNDYYLPHFKVFWWSSIYKWVDTRNQVNKQLLSIINKSIKHLNQLKELWFDIAKIDIEFWHTSLLYDLVKKTAKSEKPVEYIHQFRKSNSDNEILDELNVWLPNFITNSNELSKHWLKKYSNIFSDIEENVIHKLDFEIPYVFNLSRLWWVWHYNWIVFTIFVTDSDWNRFDIVDWGMTDWGKDIICDNKVKTIVFAIWTELLSKNF